MNTTSRRNLIINIAFLTISFTLLAITSYLAISTLHTKRISLLSHGRNNDKLVSYSEYIKGENVEDVFYTAPLLEEGISKIPHNVISAYYRDGGFFCFCSEDSLYEMNNSAAYDETSVYNNRNRYTLGGFYLGGELYNNVICLNVENPYVDSTVIHELGHYVDNKVGRVSRTDAWEEVWLTERCNSGLGDYFTGDAGEYFAESYCQYKLNPEELQAKCPMTYEIIKAAEERI